MPVNDLIRVPDYNDIRNVIIAVMSTGSATQGYGQTILSTPASEGGLVSKGQWDNLRFDIVNAIVHQTGSLPTLTEPVIGDLLRYGSAQPNFQYLTLANTANTNRFDLGVGQFTVETLGSRSQLVEFSGSASCTITVTFGSANEARYFFNSGGTIRFNSSFVSTLDTTQSNSWVTLLNSLGTISFGGNSPAVNFYNLTSSDQTYYSQGTTGTYYNMNRWTLQARCNVSNNSSGTASQIIFTSIWQDQYIDPGFPAPGDAVRGTFTINATQQRALGALYPNLVPGSFSAPSPTSTIFSTITTTGAPDFSGPPPPPPPAFTYGISPSTTAFNEGSSITMSIVTTGFGSGTLFYTIEGTSGTVNSNDFTTALSGSVTITNNAGSFTITTRADTTTEGSEQFIVRLRTGSTSGTIVATSSTISINDTSQSPLTPPPPPPPPGVTYNITPSTTSVNEGSSVTMTVTTTGFGSGTLFYTIEGTSGTVNSSDFTTALSGSVTITSNSGSFLVTTIADATTEGSEQFIVRLRTGSISGTIVATSSTVTINDTSQSPPPPPAPPPTVSYSITPTTSSINEGGSVTMVVTTNNFGSGTLFYTIEAASGNIFSNDFTSPFNGSVTITNNGGSFTIIASEDAATEGTESFRVRLRTGSTSGTIVATSSVVTINDTSQTPPSPTLNITFQSLSDYVVFGPGTQTKQRYVRAVWDSAAGGTQAWSLTTSPSLSTDPNLTSGTSGTWSGAGFTTMVATFTGPHPASNATLTVTRSGYQAFTQTLTIPANSLYSPYTFTSGFPQESGQSGSLAADVLSLYYNNNSFTVTVRVSGDPAPTTVTRWALFRDPDYGGAVFWTSTCAANGWTSGTQAYRNSFFQTIEDQGGGNDFNRARTGTKSFEANTGYGSFQDRP